MFPSLKNAAWALASVVFFVHSSLWVPYANFWITTGFGTAEEVLKVVVRESFALGGRIVNGVATFLVALLIDRSWWRRKQKAWTDDEAATEWRPSTLNAIVERMTDDAGSGSTVAREPVSRREADAPKQQQQPAPRWWHLRRKPTNETFTPVPKDSTVSPPLFRAGLHLGAVNNDSGMFEDARLNLELFVARCFEALRLTARRLLLVPTRASRSEEPQTDMRQGRSRHDPSSELIRTFSMSSIPPANQSQTRPQLTRSRSVGNAEDVGRKEKQESEGIVTAADLIRKAGYPVEVHVVTTTDGYVLRMERIPRIGSKQVTFFVHGVMDTSLCWVCSGVTGSQAFAAWDAGFDVWLSNCRCNPPRAHVDGAFQGPAYWHFTVNELAVQDMHAQLEHIHATKCAEIGVGGDVPRSMPGRASMASRRQRASASIDVQRNRRTMGEPGSPRLRSSATGTTRSQKRMMKRSWRSRAHFGSFHASETDLASRWSNAGSSSHALSAAGGSSNALAESKVDGGGEKVQVNVDGADSSLEQKSPLASAAERTGAVTALSALIPGPQKGVVASVDDPAMKEEEPTPIEKVGADDDTVSTEPCSRPGQSEPVAIPIVSSAVSNSSTPFSSAAALSTMPDAPGSPSTPSREKFHSSKASLFSSEECHGDVELVQSREESFETAQSQSSDDSERSFLSGLSKRWFSPRQTSFVSQRPDALRRNATRTSEYMWSQDRPRPDFLSSVSGTADSSGPTASFRSILSHYSESIPSSRPSSSAVRSHRLPVGPHVDPTAFARDKGVLHKGARREAQGPPAATAPSELPRVSQGGAGTTSDSSNLAPLTATSRLAHSANDAAEHSSVDNSRESSRDGAQREPYAMTAIGHSLGGAALLMYTVTCLRFSRPHRLARLVLLTPAGFVDSVPAVVRPVSWALPWLLRAVNWLFPAVLSLPFYLPSSLLRSLTFRLTADMRHAPALSKLFKAWVTLCMNGDPSDWDQAMQLPHYNKHSMPAVSLLQALHMLQWITTGRFTMFDYGSEALNIAAYGTKRPPDIAGDYWRIDIPVDIAAGRHDRIIGPECVRKHISNLQACGVRRLSYREFDFGHLDFTFSAKEELRHHVVSCLQRAPR